MAVVHQPLPQAAFKPTLVGVGHGTGLGSPLGLGCQSGKDSRWLTLEVCREYARNKCTRTEDECRFAHPPPNVEVQNGRVMCCFDSIKGRCQRTEPPCKYLHPPQHLKEQLLQNGRNNLLLKNLHWQTVSPGTGIHPIVPTATVYPMANGGFLIQNPAAYAPYYSQPVMTNILAAIDQSNSNIPVSTMSPALTSPDQQQSSTSLCHTSDITCPVNGVPTTCGGVSQSYWQPVTAPGPLSSAYVVDSQTGTTYYSPTGFFQGVNAPNGLVVKGAPQSTPQVGTSKNGLTVYTPCAPPPPYQPVALASCYPVPMGTAPMGQPPPVAAGPAQRY